MKNPISVETRMWSRRHREMMVRSISYQPCEAEGCTALGCWGYPFGSYCNEHHDIGEEIYARSVRYHHLPSHSGRVQP